ncbi:glycosyltransferase family 61 protein [Paracoccus marinaquae]|uniref:Glycosyltransferase family 61 protein n=1 Tax=Paracoccus marinaquae TaxID=2841926 RepID=A0ABS6AFQ3_9RHOB|nr:glycosyltransferase 61 family protein [Paracoccus marinaquae]MBU3029431.1 glycosyltransferase family 61 protein [Paracoccus marinaquae]
MKSPEMPSPLPPAPFRLPLPDPDRGWSRTVMRVRGAVIDPSDGGVWCDGALCPEAMLYRWRGAYKGRKGTVMPADPARIAGRHLWGGTLFFHFGHFLSESLGRLWAAEASGAESILFTPKNPRGKRPEDLVGFQKQVLARLGIELPVRILYAPAMVEDLLIPGQGFGLGALARGTPEFRAFARRMDPDPDAGPGTGARRLYISRTALPRKTGSVLGEAWLEEQLRGQGFRIYHPQQHSIDHQLRTFREATHFVGPDGSAFHLAGFIARPWQNFTLIKRRSAREYVTFVDQLKAVGAKVGVIDALVANWIRPGKHKPDDMSWGELDALRLSDELQRLGLTGAPLAEPPSFADELEQISRIHGGPMTRLPVAAPG